LLEFEFYFVKKSFSLVIIRVAPDSVVKVRGSEGAQPHLLSDWPLLKFQPWLPKTWPGLHCMSRCFICLLLSKYRHS